ncbi:TPA: NUDIX domain-containing protein [Candidatus Micrarchaeota archaeon]|nr:NUDIX domain-containing protein [Candidatus Micrarchaeota archaeon]
MVVRVGAAVVLKKNGKVLLGKRSNTVGHGFWCLPGGKVELGELVEHAAKRELLEETSVRAKKLKFAGFVEALRAEENREEGWITLVFNCSSYSGKPRVVKGEKFSEWAWFSPKKLSRPIFQHTLLAFKKKLA